MDSHFAPRRWRRGRASLPFDLLGDNRASADRQLRAAGAPVKLRVLGSGFRLRSDSRRRL